MNYIISIISAVIVAVVVAVAVTGNFSEAQAGQWGDIPDVVVYAEHPAR